MNVKKIKRKCSVRGCRNIDTFAISTTREMGGSVIICKECLKDALNSVENYKDKPKDTKKISCAPPLFFSDVLKESTAEGKEKKPETAKTEKAVKSKPSKSEKAESSADNKDKTKTEKQ